MTALLGAVLALGGCPGTVDAEADDAADAGDDGTSDFWTIDDSVLPGDDDAGDDDDTGDDDAGDDDEAAIDTAYFWGQIEVAGTGYEGLAGIETFAGEEQRCGFYAVIEPAVIEPCEHCTLAVEFVLQDLETYVNLDCSDFPPLHYEGAEVRIGLAEKLAYYFDPDVDDWVIAGQTWTDGDAFGWYFPLI